MLYSISTWLLLPSPDAPDELFTAGMLTESDPMPEADARRKFDTMTWEQAMDGIENEGEPLLLSLDCPDAGGTPTCQQHRQLMSV